MNQTYKEALSEVEFVLSRFDKSDTDKIPQNFKDFISENKCKWYEITEDDELKEETLAILAIIYRKFLSAPEERPELERRYQERLKEETEKLKQMIDNNKSTTTTAEIHYDFVQPTIVKKEEMWYNNSELAKIPFKKAF